MEVTHKFEAKQLVWVVDGRGKKHNEPCHIVRCCQTDNLPYYIVKFDGLVSLYSFEEHQLRAAE
jgi:hypothetical protein